MRIGIVGLGLIGGSFAKAYKIDKHTVLGYDINKNITAYAKLSGVLDDELTDDTLPLCDLVLLAVSPHAACDYITEHASHFAPDQLVIDCCGIKGAVCDVGFAAAKAHGFLFIGGHPMAGTQFSGFKNSRADMFHGATMALIPPVMDDINITERAKTALSPAGFSHFSVWTAEKHDEVIAFTSQLAHLVSNAYMKSPTARKHTGLSAGSYRDLTRVARLNAPMWAELCMDNKSAVLYELDSIIRSLSEYKEALASNDKELLAALLKRGSDIKQEVDGLE